ncbi:MULTISPECIES: flagellar hook protein FlgE [Bacillus]|uniref:Flagellar hook protein FlgE n=3 Tax=Bacillus cereus group TaxID=86661 RepID=A0A2B6WCQ6_9BACI|nr:MULTISPECIES: flagellar hook protein FlgE [Bacillus]AFU12321.1 Flagellar hook protein flgE [Bacillus thuringiensis MC28]EEL23766.1 Flagellar hook protein flgE [Bacillus cereus Rock1-3]EEL35169.1 Flagellar hook protein flgE [Bacillus cereus Rock3-28]EJR60075.1 flagellar hook-basal body protein [Bacillus cereus VD115]EOP27749.1 flagellar hook-basal body protein [Bacillus cereus VD131]KNH39019.1 flagellar hook protein FlgE [Bacillus thuringiensis]KXY19216.1 flagellar biosynthesis protein Flg
MIKALYTSITGMNATQNALSVTSNNIANAQTVGYKKQKAMFDDLLYNNSIGAKGDGKYAGTNPKSIGNGVKMSGTVTDYSDGTITLTGGKTQAAMEGNGFFVVGDSKGGNMEFTRKGTFGISSDYYITNTEGQYVFAYPANEATGEVDLSGIPGPLQIPMGTAIGGIRTSKGTIKGNIPTGEKQITQDLPVYDNAGNTWTMRVEFKQTSEHNYTYKVQMRNDSKKETEFKDVQGAGGNMTFDAVGNPNPKEQRANIPFDGGSINLDLSHLTNHPTDKTLSVTDVDGRAAATVKDCFIADGGYVMVKYSDGSMKSAGQLAVAMFPNEGGLMKTGNGNYTATNTTGILALGASGQNGAGKVRGGAQEGANVDLSVEFVDLMLYQRGFQGNAKVIKVSDEVLNEVVNLIR